MSFNTHLCILETLYLLSMNIFDGKMKVGKLYFFKTVFFRIKTEGVMIKIPLCESLFASGRFIVLISEKLHISNNAGLRVYVHVG